MVENTREMICRKCRKVISDSTDRLEHNGKIYCPICYVKVIKGGPSTGTIFWWILGIIMLICIIISWIAYFVLSAYY